MIGGGDLNLENGTGKGSLVQKTVSSNGTPYPNEASGSGSVALGKKVKSKGNATFVTGQENEAIVGTSASFTSGRLNVNRGSYNITGGENNANNNSWSLVIGKGNAVSDGRFGIVSGLDNVYTGPGDYKNTTVSMLGNNLYVQNENQPTNGALLIGQYNKVQNNSNRLFVVGNGTSNNDRKNAFEVLKDGRAKVQSAPIDDNDAVRKQELDNSWNEFNLENGTGTGSLVQKRLKSDGVTWTTAKAYQGASTALGGGTQAGRTEDEFNAYFWDSATNKPLHGGDKNSSGEILDNHGLTYDKSYSFSFAEGEQTKAFGRGSHSEGYYTETKEEYSHAEGWKTVSRGLASHAEGSQTNAIGKYSHAEGFGTSAIGDDSHSEGMSTEARGYASHVEGFATRTLEMYQHVEGVYNADNPNALHIVGNGTSEADRKNAFEVLEDGRAKVQSAPVDDDDVVRKKDLDKPYELIEEITLTEDTNIINRTDYNFKELYIRVNVPQYTDTHNVLFVINGGSAINCRDVINKNFNAISALYASIKGDLLFMGYTQNTNDGTNALEYKQGAPYVNASKINKLTLSQDAGNVIPAGTVIQIYGR